MRLDRGSELLSTEELQEYGNAVLLLLRSDSYQARRESAHLVPALYQKFTDPQV